MRINHNIAALNTHRQLSSANNANQNSMEKLSSGLRINNASDDAAGLAISEKMRGQIRGLEQAQTNAQDGISMIQTAEGALNETHDILQRMRELAVQSANDTNTDTDRGELQKEVDQLSKELTRIGDNTEFNTQNLLDGSLKSTFQIGANEGQNLSLDVSDMRALSLGVVSDISTTIDSSIAAAPGTTSDVQDGTYTVAKDGDTYQLKDTDGNVVATGTDGKTFTGTGADNDGSTFGDDAITLTDTAKIGGKVEIASATVESFDAELSNTTLEAGDYTASTTELTDSSGNVIATSTDATSFTNSSGDTVLSFGTAITADTSLSVGGIDISSQSAADSSITKINEAIETVSAERSKLGAVQNRLDHTINNLGTSSENLTAAESRIRDVDYALAA
ncbi:flagellin [Halobacillus litoralis]|uniref:flagellin N-terminal helical domain-containing protein n=1 Tax=Halobacillus litoralis TaxID=45668 RepID=UPI001CFD58E6|nr:flagellin [Halobacillus litoralis]WLR49258.1 flagellin [Halobacillus litoralis]